MLTEPLLEVNRSCEECCSLRLLWRTSSQDNLIRQSRDISIYCQESGNKPFLSIAHIHDERLISCAETGLFVVADNNSSISCRWSVFSQLVNWDHIFNLFNSFRNKRSSNLVK